MADDEDPPEIPPPPVTHINLFSPSSYNLPHFKYKHLPASEIRNAWKQWIRWFENVMAAANVSEPANKKIQLLAMGGMELQSAYYGLPDVDSDAEDNEEDPYLSAKQKLTQHFSPKHHDSFERFLFGSMSPEPDEPIEKFALRVQQKADKICFGKTAQESRQIAIIDKIIRFATDDLRQKLLEKETLTLDDTLKTVNAFQSVRYQSAKMNRGSASHDVNRLTVKRSNPEYPRSYPSRPETSQYRGPQNRLKCSRCGYEAHRQGERCPAVDKTCNRCGVVGHFGSVCHTKSRDGWVSFKPFS